LNPFQPPFALRATGPLGPGAKGRNIIPLGKREAVKKLGLPVGWEYLQSFTIAVVLKGEVIRPCK